MTEQETARATTNLAVIRAAISWSRAPIHIKAMGAEYMSPIVEALMALNSELQTIKVGEE